MINRIQRYIKEQPLGFLLISALLVRLVAAIFSKGWLMFDDHYLIVEVAGSWAQGGDVQHWLPWTEGNKGPHFMSFFYVGLIWLFFEFLQLLGIESPENQMFLLRLVHAFYSVLTVYYAYKITEKISNKKNAFLVGLILAFLGYFPVFGVKQLVEMVCVPVILGAYYYLLKDERFIPKNYIIAGVMAGLAIGVRYQSGLIFLGIGLVMLWQLKWKELTTLVASSVLVFFLTQASDIYLWGEPFVQLREYIFHNSTHSQQYVTSPWYTYVLTLAGFLIPPVSLMLLFGFFRKFKSQLIFVLPVVLFLIFHSVYPNKQERFILPVIPLIVMVGVMGWNEFKNKSVFWNKNRSLHKGLWTSFWIINTIVLFIFTPAYSKRQYTETMVYLSEQEDLTRFVLDNSNVDRFTMVPLYYYGNWDFQYVINKQHNIAHTQANILLEGEHPYPNYIVFYNDQNLEARMDKAIAAFGPLEFRTIIEPGYLDKLLAFVNPHNKIERVHIYKMLEGPKNKELNP